MYHNDVQGMSRSNNGNSCTSYEARQKELVQQLLLEAAERCLIAKRNNNGKLPHGCMKSVLSEIGCPELNRDKVNYKIGVLEAEAKQQAEEEEAKRGSLVDDASTNISQLTSPSMLSQLTDDTESSGRKKGGRPRKLDAILDERAIARRKAVAVTQASICCQCSYHHYVG